MTELNFHLGAELKGVVAEALRRQGYQVLEDGNPTAVDAVLNVEILGYFKTRVPVYAAFGGSVFKPMFAANATLRDASTKRTLFRRLYAYSALPAPIDGTILFRPDPKYSFKTSEEIFDRPQFAAEGFRAAEPVIARFIASDLKKP